MSGALSGIRAIELAMFQNGPASGYMLGDMGAEIIKIEDRVTGDNSRGTSSLWGLSTEHKGINLFFETPNRNKRSITLDLKKEKGRNAACLRFLSSEVVPDAVTFPCCFRNRRFLLHFNVSGAVISCHEFHFLVN